MSTENLGLLDPATVGPGTDRPTAFITASGTVDTSVVREALRRRGYTPFSLDEIDAGGMNVAELLREFIPKADLVVAVIGDDAMTKDVFYELGFAQAYDKRVLALSPSGFTPQYQGMACLKTDPTNLEAIEFGLDQILAAPKDRPRNPSDAGWTTHPIGEVADELFEEYRRLCDEPDAQRRHGNLESIVARAIEASGVTAISEKVTDDYRHVDIAVWSDDLEPWIRNPLLVEIKANLGNKEAFENGLSQLKRHLDSTGSQWGLMIGHGQFGLNSERKIPSNILVVTIEDLLHSLKTTGFGRYIRRLRNARVHGKT